MRKKARKVSLQLCLFDAAEMAAMAEPISPLKPIDIFIANPARLHWQLEIGQSLRGKEGRQHRRMFAQRRRRARVVFFKPINVLYDS